MAARLLDRIDRSTQLAGFNRIALLLFRLDDRQLFGINVLKVQEVIRRPQLTRMPGSHPYVRGVADIRGAIVPVIDLRIAVGDPPDDHAEHVIVAEFSRSVQAFQVRAVERIVHIDVATLAAPPHSSGDEGFLTAITRWNDEIVEIIDVERVLSEVVGGAPERPLEPLEHGAVPEGLRVLVADDSRVARSQIERVLTRLGIEAVLVNDGAEALSHLRELASRGDINSQLAMLISDIEMPVMDGYHLMTEIRRDPQLKSLYVLLHTSLSGGFNSSMVKSVGANKFVSKFSAEDLAREVVNSIRERCTPA
jgi:two-component system chemotaxis response regulator CheV